MSNRDFVKEVTTALGGITKVLDKAVEVRTRGFDAQIPLKKTYKGVNTIKVTNENGKLEVMFYMINPKKYILKKIATVEIKSIDELASVIEKQIGLKF